MSKKRISGGLMAAAMALNCLAAVPFTTFAEEVIGEFEDGTLENDAKVQKDLAGYSGSGYVYLEDNSSTIPSATATVNLAEAGNFALIIGYAAPYGNKGATIEVNGENIGQVTFEESEGFAELNVGKVAFKAGENTVKINSTWGYTIVDYVKVTEYQAPERPEIKATQTATCDTNATKETKALMSYLASVYGSHILSGQQEIYKYGPHDIETEFNYIEEKTGKLPAIRGFDYGNFCCPAFGSDDGSTERVLAWAAKGGIATASFHLNVPTDFASYTIGSNIAWDQTTYSQNTDFSPAKAATEVTKENQYYTQALDTLAEQFLILQEKGVPVIWRPLHEAEGAGGEGGSWFWWGREGSKAYRDLWVYTYNYLTETKGCHNLIWEWNSYDYSTSANWYPGDNYVDIIGYDKYNCTDWSTGQAVLVHNTSAIPDTFYNIMARYNNAKMVAMAECDSFSTVENLTTEKAGWLYFMPWYDGGTDATNFLSNPMFNTEEDLIAMYQSDYCITLDELPKLSDVEYDPTETNEVVNTEPTEAEAGHAVIGQDDKGNFTIDLPEASDTVYLTVELPDGCTYANGGLGVSIEINGTYYWANVQWEAKKSGTIELNLADNLLNVTEGVEPVEDEAIINTVKEKLSTVKSFQGQIWYAEKAETTDVKITDAYVKSEGTEDPSEEASETETESESAEPSESETEATSETDAAPGKVKYGDANLDGSVNIVDVITINKAILGKETLSGEGLVNVDLNHNQKPDSDESLAILKFIVGLLSEADLANF